MKRKKILDSIEIPNPCSQSWAGMNGNDEVRFCSSCETNIYNLSAMTRQEAEKLLKNSNGKKLCVRYEKNSKGKIVTAPPKLTQITRRATIAAGVLATTLSLSAMNYAQGEPIIGKERLNQKVSETSKQSASISGLIRDVSGASIKAFVVLRNTKNNKVFRSQSDENGFYKFGYIEPNIYDLEIEAVGFKKSLFKKIKISKNKDLKKDVTMQVADFVVGTTVTNDPTEAQSSNIQSLAKVSGTISDLYGAVIPGTRITLRNRKTGKVKIAKSDKVGFYEFRNIEPSVYDLEVYYFGFDKTVIKNFEISKEDKIVKDLTLYVTPLTEVVGLFAAPDIAETTQDKLSSHIIEKGIQFYPTIFGVIRDQNGAIISNAKVILKNKKTKKKVIIYSDENGSYQFANLESGNYELSIERQLFKKVKIKDLKISEDSKIKKDFILDVASKERITIGLLMFNEK